MVLSKLGRSRIGRDRGDLGIMDREGPIEGRRKMRRRDAPEWRRPERTGPLLEKRIVGVVVGRGGRRMGLIHSAEPR